MNPDFTSAKEFATDQWKRIQLAAGTGAESAREGWEDAKEGARLATADLREEVSAAAAALGIDGAGIRRAVGNGLSALGEASGATILLQDLRAEGDDTGDEPKSEFATLFRDAWRAAYRAWSLIFETTPLSEAGIAGSGALAQIAAEEQHTAGLLRASLASLAFAASADLLWEPLRYLAYGAMLFVIWPLLRAAAGDLTGERRITVRLLDPIAAIGLLAAGYLVACPLYYSLRFGLQQAMLRIEAESRRRWIRRLKPPASTTEADAATVLVAASEPVPVDGVVLGGSALVAPHVLSAEGEPVRKRTGDRVFAGTTVLSGALEIRPVHRGETTLATRLVENVVNSARYRSQTQEQQAEFGGRSVLPTFGLAVAVRELLSPSSAVATVASNYGASLPLAASLGWWGHMERTLGAGILTLDPSLLERTERIDTVVFVEPGGLTTEPRVETVYAWAADADEDGLLALAAAAESQGGQLSTGPLAREAATRDLALPRLDGRAVTLAPAEPVNGAPGRFLISVSLDGQPAGAVELQSHPREQALEATQTLRDGGIEVHLLSPGSTVDVKELAESLGVSQLVSAAPVTGTAKLVEDLIRGGKNVCVVGGDASLPAEALRVTFGGAGALLDTGASAALPDEELSGLFTLFGHADDWRWRRQAIAIALYAPGVLSAALILFANASASSALLLGGLAAAAAAGLGLWPTAVSHTRPTNDLAA